MPVVDFPQPAAGWCRELSPSAKIEIANHLPGLPVDRIAKAAGEYALERDKRWLAPKEIHERLKRLMGQIEALEEALDAAKPVQWLVEEVLDGVKPVVQRTKRMNIGDALDRLPLDLRAVRLAANKAANRVPRGGRLRSPRHRLVCRLVNAVPHLRGQPGKLALLLKIIFADFGEAAADTRKIVADAFGKRRR